MIAINNSPSCSDALISILVIWLIGFVFEILVYLDCHCQLKLTINYFNKGPNAFKFEKIEF